MCESFPSCIASPTGQRMLLESALPRCWPPLLSCVPHEHPGEMPAQHPRLGSAWAEGSVLGLGCKAGSCPQALGSLLSCWLLVSSLEARSKVSVTPVSKDKIRVFGTRYRGKTSWVLEVGREEEKRTKECPPSVGLKPVVVLCLAQFPHCTALGGCSPLADALPRAMRVSYRDE